MKQIYRLLSNYLKDHRATCILSVIAYFVVAALAMLPAKLMQMIIDEAFLKYNINLLYKYIVVLALIYCMKTLLTYLSNRSFITLGNGALKAIKAAIYNRLMEMDLTFFTDNEIGFINSRVEEINAIDTLFSTNVLSLVSSIVEFIFAAVILFSMNWRILLILSIPIPFLLTISLVVSRKMIKQLKDSLDSAAEYMGQVQSSLRGMESVKSQNLENVEKEKLNTYNAKALEKQKQRSNTLNGFSVGLGSVSFVLTLIVYLIGGIFFINHDLTMGTFFAISSYAGKLYSPIIGYIGTSILIQPAIVSLQRIATFFFDNDIENENIDYTKDIEEVERITFNNVTFSYNSTSDVLHNVSCIIQKGGKYQITGQNGSGKTTLIRLLLKLIAPKSGEILLNDIELISISKDSWLKQISYVSQRNFLFNESVRDNITYGIGDVDEVRLANLMDKLGLNNIEQRLVSEHRDSKVGENASRLSGGERQKISIARALLLNRPIFIFDEAFSSIDSLSAENLRDIIKDSTATWIIIDHQFDYTELGFREIPL